MIQYKWDIYKLAFMIGAISIVRGNLLNGFRLLLAPVLYWRFSEFSECLASIDAMKRDYLKILDIGSPKLLSLFLALKRRHTVYATDLQDTEIFSRYKRHFDDWQSVKGASGKYIVELQDARSLQYNDNTFDVVFSLEVLGHIPDEGDITAMQEIYRVLKKDGVAVIAVPYADKAKCFFVQHDVYDSRYQGSPIFYLRQYDKHSVENRIIKTSGMKLLEKKILGERFPFNTWWDRVPLVLKTPFMWLEPLISRCNLKVMDNNLLQRDIVNGYKRHMNITLILKK